jgi:hypothetical protein
MSTARAACRSNATNRLDNVGSFDQQSTSGSPS